MPANAPISQRLKKYYAWYSLGFVVFILLLALLEHLLKDSFGIEVSSANRMVGYLFMFATIGMYAVIGIACRTSDVTEYYVAGRRVPAVFNGMATAADWMSAASFIGMAGILFSEGFDGLVYVLGWTGGFCLLALLLAPYLRKFGKFTIPDFLAERYDSKSVRLLAVVATILCSFVYVVAQIYGVGIITSRFTGIEFGVGVFLGLAGVLVCSFLGGMRGITWTQVAQYIILIVAYLTPVIWLSIKQTGNPIPQLTYGQQLNQLSQREQQLFIDPREIEVRKIYLQHAEEYRDEIETLPASWEAGRKQLQKNIEALSRGNAPLISIRAAESVLKHYPQSPDAARKIWQQAQETFEQKARAPQPHAQPFHGDDGDQKNHARNNFLALMCCLMLGTASLPHLLARCYTTPSVAETRKSVSWALLFILLLYITAPALAVLVKFDILNHLVGTPFSQLPAWVGAWARVDSTLLSVADVNHDGVLQWAEINMGSDIVVLATPEIAGLPYVISGLVAAGGLAAALSTADSLLLAISSALSHDVYYKMIEPKASPQQRVTLSKITLLCVAVVAAYVTSLKVGNILSLVGAAFSIAASSLFPALVCGIFWKRANKAGAIAGIFTGLFVCVFYMFRTYSFLGGDSSHQWFGIEPISAAVFGVPAGFAALVLVSLNTAAPPKESDDFVEQLRSPDTPTK
ncbi:MAG: cation acetate symporter [Burkholderiaceae bacterium]|nr:MAG: cation acetate symporter [Burkholderiaceae bacterium]